MSENNGEKKTVADSGLTDAELDEIAEVTQNTPNIEEVKPDVSETALDDVSTDAPDSSTVEEPVNDESHDINSEDLTPTETAANDRDYFDDDEEFLRGDDKVIHTDSDIALFKQEEGVISWEIANFYKENGKPRSQRSLRNDPPILKISSSDGVTADFLVTHQFAKSLSFMMNNVSRAYYGVSPTEEKKKITQSTIKDKISSMGNWIRAHKIKSTIALVLIGFILGSTFLL